MVESELNVLKESNAESCVHNYLSPNTMENIHVPAVHIIHGSEFYTWHRYAVTFYPRTLGYNIK
jgi:hypothetical protein